MKCSPPGLPRGIDDRKGCRSTAGRRFHIEIGTGKIDWDDTLRGLAGIGYRGSMIPEPNPDRVTPDGIRRSAAYLRQRVRELGLNV